MGLGLTCLLSASLWLAEAPYEVSLVSPPRLVTERQTAVVEVRYRVPAGAPVPLKLELKNDRGQVISTTSVMVSGTGTHPARYAIPSLLTTSSVQFVVWLGNDWRTPLGEIVHSPAARLITAQRAAAMAADRERVGADVARFGRERRPGGLVAVYHGERPEPPLVAGLRAAGVGVVVLDGPQLASDGLLRTDLWDLLILAEPRSMPAAAMDTVTEYVRGGGRLVSLGAGAFEDLRYEMGGRWLSRSDYLSAVAQALPQRIWLDFDGPDVGDWRRDTNQPQFPSEAVREAPGAAGSAGAMRINISNKRGWDTFATEFDTSPFRTGETWTTFWAKGGPHTPQLVLEWREADDSRWLATVELSSEWRPYALPPTAFRYWSGPPTRDRNVTFDPSQARLFAVGLADTHTQQVGHGAHTLWIDQIGTAPAPLDQPEAVALTTGRSAALPVEAVSPAYKLFAVNTARRWRAGTGGSLSRGTPLPPLPAEIKSPHPRPEGTSLDRGRSWRFVPLLETVDRDGLVCGTPAVIVLHGADRPSGGAVLSVTIDDAAWWADARTQRWLQAACLRLLDGLFLYEGGAASYASFGGEEMPVGALVSNRGRRAREYAVRARVRGEGMPEWRREWTQTVEADSFAEVRDDWTVPVADGPYDVSIELLADNQVVDRLQHQVQIWRPKMEPSYITAADGDFWQGRRKWYAHGINYMPSSGIATEDGEYFEHWISARAYDPAIIERDLTRVRKMGLNQVSVFMYYPHHRNRNLLDLLIRCEQKGLKVNLSLRPGTPLDFEWDWVREMITSLRLPENDTIYAYDLAWEPNWGMRAELTRWDAEWAEWLATKYGSVAEAEAAWGTSARREDGVVVGPDDTQLSQDGAWTPMVVAYRDFLNDLIRKYYGRARELVQRVDPNHLVSYRMSGAGDPLWAPPMTTYDFLGLADAVDFLSPEGYGRGGDWPNIKVGHWTMAYGRAVAPELPIFWAEFGESVWSSTQNAADPARVAHQGEYYNNFYRLMWETYSNGSCAWWYPGGFRVGENSDYGVIDPDGAWRPATHAIADWAARLTRSRERPEPDVVIPLDTRASGQGIFNLYLQSQEAFWRALDGGQHPTFEVR